MNTPLHGGACQLRGMPCPESSIPDTLKWLSEPEMERERKREREIRHAKHFLHSAENDGSLKILNWRGKWVRKEIATSLPRYPVSFGRCCQRRKESKEERREQSKDTKWRARLVTRRATLRIVARSTLTRIERGGRQGEEDDEGGGWAARRANLMGMQCGNFSLDLVLLPFLPPPLPFLPLCPHLVPAALA